MKRNLLFKISGIGLAVLLTSCGTKDQVLSPLANGTAGAVAAVGNTAGNVAGNTAATLANGANSVGNAARPAPKPTASRDPFSLRDGEKLVNHRIASGDTLSSLARRYGTRVSRIQAANNMTGTKIILGKSLKVPTSGAIADTPRPAQGAPVPPAAAVPAAVPAAPAAAPAPASRGFAGFKNPALKPSAPVAPAPVAPAPAPNPAPAPAAAAPSGLPSFNGGLQIQD